MSHIVKAYDSELAALGGRIAAMGEIARGMIADGMDALVRSDADLARATVARDPRLDSLQREIEDIAVVTIARRQPLAVDLREIVGAIRIAGDLERIGDLAKNIAKRSLRIGAAGRPPAALDGPRAMNAFAAALVGDVLDAYARRDVDRARDVWTRDAGLDALEETADRELLALMAADPGNIPFCAHLLFCSKNIERIGDHATNIAETVVYVVTGGLMPVDRPKGGAPA